MRAMFVISILGVTGFLGSGALTIRLLATEKLTGKGVEACAFLLCLSLIAAGFLGWLAYKIAHYHVSR